MNEDKLLKSLEELYSDLLWMDEELKDERNQLVKGPNYYKDRDPAKYKKMLAKLRRERKKPGSKERSYQQILQAKRRENGKSGTTSGQNGHSGHKNGHMKTKTGTAAKRYASAEKKAGKKMSIERKNNHKGYESSNTTLIDQKWNRGDEKYSKRKMREAKGKK